MRNVFARRGCEGDLPRVRLNGIWYVDADESYDVSRVCSPGRDYIAVRTLTGAGRLELYDGTLFCLDAGSVAVLEGAQVMHYATAGAGWQFYWFEFSAETQPDCLSETLHVQASAQEKVELERCFLSLGRSAPEQCLVAESLFAYLLADWRLRAQRTGRDASPQDVLALLEKGRRERVSVPELARMAGMSERSFRDAVIRVTGVSPKAYMLQGEMAAAMELLRTTSMSVSEIALCLDYASPSYFSRAFKKYYGIAPQLVREEIRM